MAAATTGQVLADPNFQRLTDAQKIQVLSRIDPKFAQLSTTEQQKVIGFKAVSGAKPRFGPSAGALPGIPAPVTSAAVDQPDAPQSGVPPKPGAITPKQVLTDPKFQALTPERKLAVLQRIDPNFAKLSPEQQQAVIGYRAPAGRSQTTSGRPQPASQVPDVSTAGGVVSQFAGGAGETLNPINIVRGLAQAAREQAPTDDWSLKGGLTNIGKMIEGPAGMIINPLAKATGTAAKWYWDAARGKIPYAYEQWLSAAPEALGQGAAQAALLRTPTNRLRGFAPEPGLLGVMTRAKSTLNDLETDPTSANAQVDWRPAYAQAAKINNLKRFGYTVPEPVTKFMAMIKDRYVPAKPGQPAWTETVNTGFVDQFGNPMTRTIQHPAVPPTPGQSPWLTFAEGRQFEKGIGQKVNWELDTPGAKGGEVNGGMKKLDEILSDRNTEALKPLGKDQAYINAKSDFARGAWWMGKSKAVGGFAGSLAGHAVGYPLGDLFFGHPWFGAMAGGPLGTAAGMAGGPAMMRAVLEPGALMRGTAGALGATGQAIKLGGAAQALTPQQERDANEAIRQVVQERLHPPTGGPSGGQQ